NLGRSITAEMASELTAVLFVDAGNASSSGAGVVVPAAALQSYAGVYSVSADRFFTVRLVDGKLQAKIGRQEQFHELVADSETMFYLKPIDGQLEFVRDGSGKVAEIVVHQKGRIIRKLPRTSD
ncbi:MAG TPA: DUF3471 domain-containing protein, partial [Opitutaceae bacterium]